MKYLITGWSGVGTFSLHLPIHLILTYSIYLNYSIILKNDNIFPGLSGVGALGLHLPRTAAGCTAHPPGRPPGGCHFCRRNRRHLRQLRLRPPAAGENYK